MPAQVIVSSHGDDLHAPRTCAWYAIWQDCAPAQGSTRPMHQTRRLEAAARTYLVRRLLHRLAASALRMTLPVWQCIVLNGLPIGDNSKHNGKHGRMCGAVVKAGTQQGIQASLKAFGVGQLLLARVNNAADRLFKTM